MVFLVETKVNSNRCNKVARMCKLSGVISVSVQGVARGLCLMWTENIEVTILDFTKYYIHALIDHRDGFRKWLVTCAYGPPYQQDKNKFWSKIELIANTVTEPWLLIGDLNEVHVRPEKLGGRSLGISSHNYLHDFITNTYFADIGYNGNDFTWRNKRYGPQHIRQRLDRAISNHEWMLKFPKATLTHLPATNSNHCPILLNLYQESSRKPFPFKFELAWTRDINCDRVIITTWNKKETKGSAPYIQYENKENKKCTQKLEQDTLQKHR